MMMFPLISLTTSALPPRDSLAAWLYDTKGGSPAMWSDALSSFNTAARRPINVAFSYGGDMEWYPPAGQTYFPVQAATAAKTYRNSTAGVEYVVVVIDGRMDGGEAWSPDLSKRTQAEVEAWADSTAALLCSYDDIDGVQLDLEPFEGQYVPRLVQFIARLSGNLRSRERNCASAAHPSGRSISAFMYAAAATPDVWAALGPNGYVTVSGYDLSIAPAGTPSSAAYYGKQLSAAVATIQAAADANNGSFMLGLPGAASTHEFERFTWANGTVVHGAPQLSFVKEALTVVEANALHGSHRYLGSALWGFSSTMAYPPHSQNVFSPGTPFVDPAEEIFLQQHPL